MNHSFHSADRTTHLKIVAIGLLAGIAMAGFAMNARRSFDSAPASHVTAAGKLITITSADSSIMR